MFSPKPRRKNQPCGKLVQYCDTITSAPLCGGLKNMTLTQRILLVFVVFMGASLVLTNMGMLGLLAAHHHDASCNNQHQFPTSDPRHLTQKTKVEANTPPSPSPPSAPATKPATQEGFDGVVPVPPPVAVPIFQKPGSHAPGRPLTVEESRAQLSQDAQQQLQSWTEIHSSWQRRHKFGTCGAQFANGFNDRVDLCVPLEEPDAAPVKSAIPFWDYPVQPEDTPLAKYTDGRRTPRTIPGTAQAARELNSVEKRAPPLTSERSSIECAYNAYLQGSVCVARNLMLDPSKVTVSKGGEEINEVLGRAEEVEFPEYQPGAFRARCAETERKQTLYKNPSTEELGKVLPNHMQHMLAQTEMAPGIPLTCERWEELPTLFVTRYEYANLFHTMTDWYNTYLTIQLFKLDKRDIQIVFMDGHSKGAIDEGWSILFGRWVKFLRGLGEERVCFREAYYVPPGYTCALNTNFYMPTGGSDSMLCVAPYPLLDFSHHFLKSFQLVPDYGGTPLATLLPLLPLPKPSQAQASPRLVNIAIVYRRDYLSHPRLRTIAASRKISNEDETTAAARSIPGTVVTDYDFAVMNMKEQLTAVREADILVGIHGAALSYVLFMQSGSILFEIAPPRYQARPHFRFFATWADIAYRSFTALQVSSVDDVYPVDADEFARQLGDTVVAFRTTHPELYPADYVPPPPPPPAAPINISPFTDPAGADTRKPNAGGGGEGALPPSGGDGKKLAVIVPFRDSVNPSSQGANRTANLKQFIPYMIEFLENTGRKLGRDFILAVVEQTQGQVFNKGALFNAGFLTLEQEIDYMCLHDVDQLPLSAQNKYEYPEVPTHLNSASSQFGYKMAYGSMVGGALLLTKEHYRTVNGYSNFYWGWGQEDDDFYYRLRRYFNRINRLPQNIGRYYALSHPRVMDLDATPVFNKGTEHLRATQAGSFDIMLDGLSNAKYRILNTTWIQPGVRHILVQHQYDNMPTDLHAGRVFTEEERVDFERRERQWQDKTRREEEMVNAAEGGKPKLHPPRKEEFDSADSKTVNFEPA